MLEERLEQLEMMRKALDEQTQREEGLLRRQTITREMVDDKKQEYLACTCRRSARFEIDPLQRCERNSAWTPDEGRGIV